jgi:hypothetical protein
VAARALRAIVATAQHGVDDGDGDVVAFAAAAHEHVKGAEAAND